MHKIISILFLVLSCTGCSVSRIGRSKADIQVKGVLTQDITEVVREQNITNGSFIIQKAEIEINREEGNEKVIASIKFNGIGEYSISIRSRTGIEAARIYISEDTILINDRINRTQYCASQNYLKSNYGLEWSLLPLLFGDFIGDNLLGNNSTECSDGKLNIDGFVTGTRIRYVADCNKGKTISAIVYSSLSSQGIEIHYDQYFITEGKWLPGIIEINDFKSKTTVNIIIQKIAIPWEGDIQFIPGNRYEIIELL